MWCKQERPTCPWSKGNLFNKKRKQPASRDPVINYLITATAISRVILQAGEKILKARSFMVAVFLIDVPGYAYKNWYILKILCFHCSIYTIVQFTVIAKNHCDFLLGLKNQLHMPNGKIIQYVSIVGVQYLSELQKPLLLGREPNK